MEITLTLAKKRIITISGETPEEAITDFKGQMEEKDREEGAISLWNPIEVEMKIRAFFDRKRREQEALV